MRGPTRPVWIGAIAVVGVIVVVVAALVVSDGGGCRLRSVDEQEYMAANEAMLADIPVYPGAEYRTTWNIGQTSRNACLPTENGPPYGSYSTWHVYKIPAGTSRETILDFYDDALLAEWEPVISRTYNPKACDVSYKQGEALLGVSACNDSVLVHVRHDREDRD